MLQKTHLGAGASLLMPLEWGACCRIFPCPQGESALCCLRLYAHSHLILLAPDEEVLFFAWYR